MPTTHTSLLVERRQSDETNQQIWGLLGGHDGQRPMGHDAEVTPLLFSKDILGFLMTTESQDLSLTSQPKDGALYSIVSPSLHWGVSTHTDCRVSTPTGLTNTSSNSNLVFTGGLPSRYRPGSTLLSFSGQLGCRVIWLPAIKAKFSNHTFCFKSK